MQVHVVQLDSDFPLLIITLRNILLISFRPLSIVSKK